MSNNFTETPEELFNEYAAKLNMDRFVCKDFKQHKMAEYILDYYSNLTNSSSYTSDVVNDLEPEDKSC